ncbi:hypothetical protein BASA81_008340 [Batrachochytrium salamandrivorans]|nr:hypothetical protein BASA81_008340 [Batrachochytrium salamandrivorans]
MFTWRARPKDKEEIKQKGKVKNWMECVVLMEGNERFNQPLPPAANKYTNNPMVAARIIVPPNQPPLPPSSSSSRSGPSNSSQSSPYQHLPNPKQLFAQDRAMYDLALDQQLRTETAKLEHLKVHPDATNLQIRNQLYLVQQLEQQQQLQQRQPRPRQIATLEESLKGFFSKYDTQALVDGRMERVYFWAKQHTMDELNSMLRKQYGHDLGNGGMDPVETDKLAARLDSFYKSINVFTMSEAECVKIAQWAASAGEAALNTKLRNKYGEDLDQYAAKVRMVVRPKLEALYSKHNPELLQREKGVGPLLQWTVDNGISSLNELLLEKYGEDLDGNRRYRGISDFDV